MQRQWTSRDSRNNQSAIVDSTIACRHCRSYTISRATCAIFEYASFDDETLNSELDGEDGADPDEWYIETEASPDTTDVNASLDEVDACEEPEEAASDESDGGGGEDGTTGLNKYKCSLYYGRTRLVEFPELTQLREGFLKRLQHQCKVCSIRKKKVGKRSATRFYCETCSEGDESTPASKYGTTCGRTATSALRRLSVEAAR
ncbi:hypothetical protein PC111_g16912 [Phytophthora cactorum]|nr:hypothetical protein PC111_g16912 [Phytophthora cactorum]